jgi:hypothetical protein
MARHAMIDDRRMTRHAMVHSQKLAVSPLIKLLLAEFR